MSQGHIATIQLLIEGCQNASEACDFVSETLRDLRGVKDWAYLKVGGQQLLPTEVFIPQDYEEGEIFT